MTLLDDAKADLLRYLQGARDALLWKLGGLSEYDARRPLTPTGTNLLGLVKHTASVEAYYFGDSFGRPYPEQFPHFADDAPPNADFLATPEESVEEVSALYRRVWAHSDATITALPLDAVGTVPWWGERGQVTLHRMLVHMTTETHRHAGHADVVRELVDGRVGLNQGNDNLPDADDAWWAAWHRQVQEAAERFRQ